MEKLQPERLKPPRSKSIYSGIDRLFQRVFATPSLTELIDPKSIFENRAKLLSKNSKISIVSLFFVFILLNFLNNRSVDNIFIHDFHLFYFDDFVRCVHKYDFLISLSGKYGHKIGFISSLVFSLITTFCLFKDYDLQLRYIYIKFFYNKKFLEFVFSKSFLILLSGFSIFTLLPIGFYLQHAEFYQFLCEKFVNPDYGMFSMPILGITYYYLFVAMFGSLFILSSIVLVLLLSLTNRVPRT